MKMPSHLFLNMIGSEEVVRYAIRRRSGPGPTSYVQNLNEAFCCGVRLVVAKNVVFYASKHCICLEKDPDFFKVRHKLTDTPSLSSPLPSSEQLDVPKHGSTFDYRI